MEQPPAIPARLERTLMTMPTLLRPVALTACLSLATLSVFAQAPATRPFEPQVGQAGKDVVWVPTADILVAKMLDMAEVTAQDVVMDLGSGDGRTVIAAARRGARAIGVEFNPDMVDLSRQNAASAGVSDRATFINADLFETDISEATVITLFLLPDLNLKLRPRILDLAPGTRVVSNTFHMAEWEADETVRVDGECTSWCTALFWVVPARVDGTWRLPDGELTLDQEFQLVSGALRTATGTVPVEGRLRGTDISFTAGNLRYEGRVDGGTMQGTVTGAGSGDRGWTATRR
jgi:SAM-dependent methyltransferase